VPHPHATTGPNTTPVGEPQLWAVSGTTTGAEPSAARAAHKHAHDCKSPTYRILQTDHISTDCLERHKLTLYLGGCKDYPGSEIASQRVTSLQWMSPFPFTLVQQAAEGVEPSSLR
jgi:hypothetical protein